MKLTNSEKECLIKPAFHFDQQQEVPLVLHLNLRDFKVQPCVLKEGHDVKRCPFWHFESEKRRPLEKVYYSKILCKHRATCQEFECE